MVKRAHLWRDGVRGRNIVRPDQRVILGLSPILPRLRLHPVSLRSHCRMLSRRMPQIVLTRHKMLITAQRTTSARVTRDLSRRACE
jgi:hypothetical protein